MEVSERFQMARKRVDIMYHHSHHGVNIYNFKTFKNIRKKSKKDYIYSPYVEHAF